MLAPRGYSLGRRRLRWACLLMPIAASLCLPCLSLPIAAYLSLPCLPCLSLPIFAYLAYLAYRCLSCLPCLSLPTFAYPAYPQNKRGCAFQRSPICIIYSQLRLLAPDVEALGLTAVCDCAGRKLVSCILDINVSSYFRIRSSHHALSVDCSRLDGGFNVFLHFRIVLEIFTC